VYTMDNYMKSGSFIVIQNFMVSQLELKGNELLIYAIIYGFSQDRTSKFTGSLSYLATWTNSTKRSVMNNLNSLLEKGLIIKDEDEFNNIKICKYSINFEVFEGMEKFSPVVNKVPQGYRKNFTGGMEKSSPNNIYNNIINNKKENIKRKKTLNELSSQDNSLLTLVPKEYQATFLKFITERKIRKKPMSPEAVRLAVQKLESSGLNLQEKIDCIENSIMNGYQGLFPVKQKKQKVPIGENINFETKNTPLTPEQIKTLKKQKLDF